MAKRYIRLNWQNAPSVATPINAVNLNKMDKGIDDIDEALDALESSIVGQFVNDASKINNAAATYDIHQRVNTLNDNLNNIKFNVGVTGTVVTATIPFNLPLAPGRHQLNLWTNSSNNFASSAYLLFRTATGTFITAIAEGLNTNAPRCTASEDGVAILLNTQESARSVYYCIQSF